MPALENGSPHLKENRENASTFTIGRGATISDIEDLFSKLPAATEPSPDDTSILKVATHQAKDIFADIWSAMAVGTFCRHMEQNSSIIMWGISKITEPVEESKFVNSLPGLTAVQMASSVVSDGPYGELNQDYIERVISYHRRGILEEIGGTTRTLCEFDPQQPIALALLGELPEKNVGDQRRLFRQTVLQFRSDLEIGVRNRGLNPADAGSMRQLTTFLSELHDNSYNHGRLDSSNIRKIRFLRLRKHMATNKQELARRANSIPMLQNYIENITRDDKSLAIIEASISDFGLGILDHFLRSPYGSHLANVDRAELLHKILLERLSAKGEDPGAGQGLSKALRAAKQMSAFVSLRTAEFWLGQSYLEPDATLTLQTMRDMPTARVVGTHWQFIWPQPV